MTAPTASGILRSRPRYSSTADGDANESDGDVDDSSPNNNSSTANATTGTCIDRNQLGRTAPLSTILPSPKNKTRSLADLVKSSSNLNAEAGNVMDSERGNVISHKTSESQEQKGVKFTERENSMSTLHISERGTPYLKQPTENDNATSAGPYVVDADTPLAFGVVGEDGQQVRFCEHENDNNGEMNDGNDLSSRDRLEKNLEPVYDDTTVDHGEEGENENDGHDSESDDSSMCALDKEILEELGLSEEGESDAEGEMVVCVESELSANAEDLRSFRILWELLSRWTTPSTIELVLNYQGKRTHSDQHELSATDSTKPNPSENSAQEEKSSAESFTRNETDIGASRRTSITSMLKMSLRRSFSDLKRLQPGNENMDQRVVEQRLADIVRTFDSSAPAAKLNMKMWKGLTTILIAIVCPSSLPGDEIMLPSSIRTLGMSAAEYRYLIQSAIISLGGMV